MPFASFGLCGEENNNTLNGVEIYTLELKTLF